jgi:hypothetical protein
MPDKRGRPPLAVDDPSVDVHVRLPATQYAAICKRAEREQTSVPDLIRRVLKTRGRDADPNLGT